LIGDEGPIGRIELSRKLILGEGAARTIIRHLTRARLVSVVKNGCTLTKRGQELYHALRSRLSKTAFIEARQLSLDKFNAAMSIRGGAQRVRLGIEQRDAAVRAGATGACTLVIRGRRYVMPMSDTGETKLEPDDALVLDLEAALHPRNHDAVTIVGASEEGVAEHAAFAAALTMLD